MKISVYLYNIYVVLINLIASFSVKISDRARSVMMNGSLFLLSGLFMLRYCSKDIRGFLHYSDYQIAAPVILLLVLLIASIDRKVGLKRSGGFSLLFGTGWWICFVIMVITSFIYPVRGEYLCWGILSITVFPLFMIIWNKRGDYYGFCRLIAVNMVQISYIYLALNLIMSAFITNEFYAEGLDDGFLGIAANPNSNGMIVLPFFTAALYLLLTERKRRFVYLFSMAFSLMLIIISTTRASEAAVIPEVIAAAVLYLRHRDLYRHHRLSAVSLAVIAGAVALSVLAGCILMYFDRTDLNAYAIAEETKETEETEEWTPLVDEMSEAAAVVYGNETLTKLNAVSSGRLLLWLAYTKVLKFTGHGNPRGEVFMGHPNSKWAHNNAIDIWYASGFIAFAGYLIWLLAGWIFVFRSIIAGNSFRKEHLFTVLAFIGYFVEAMLEITIYPTNTGIVFLMYMTLAPVAFSKLSEKTEHQ